MIDDYYISCEQFRATVTKDIMDVDVLTYEKINDITGVVDFRGERVLVNDVWHYKNTPLFITSDVLLKFDRVNYKNILYEIVSDPNNIMERNHHYEFQLEAVI